MTWLSVGKNSERKTMECERKVDFGVKESESTVKE